MAKMEWDEATAKSKQRKLSASTEKQRAQTIASMVFSCIRTMKKKGEHKNRTETELLQIATEWAEKTALKNRQDAYAKRKEQKK